MKKKAFCTFTAFFLAILLMPASILAKADPITTPTGETIAVPPEDDYILVKDVMDEKYNPMLQENQTFLKENLSNNFVDFSTLLAEIKKKPNCIIVGSYNQTIQMNPTTYQEIFGMIAENIYQNCCKYLPDYSEYDLISLLKEEFGQDITVGNSYTKTFLFVAQNKKTGAFMTFTPVIVEIKAEKNSSTKSSKKNTQTNYSATIKSLTYLNLLQEVVK